MALTANVVVADAPVEMDSECIAPLLEKHFDSLLPKELPAKVVIKPNLCDMVSWDMGVTTDPAWIAFLAKILRRRRPDVQIQVVESDAISAYRSYRSCDETFDRLGFREVTQREDVGLVNLSRQRAWDIFIPQLNEPLHIPELFFDDFFYISLANVKVHPYERFTGTLKNGLGLLPHADISRYHMRLPEIIVAIYRLCTPDLAVLDGRIGLEGKGPIIGQPKVLGKVILGDSGLAVDVTASRIIGASPERVPHLRYATKALNYDSESVNLQGDLQEVPFEFDPEGVHSLILKKFKLRRFHQRLEKASLRLLHHWESFKKRPITFLNHVARKLAKRNGR